MLRAELWSQNPHTLVNEFLPAVDILKTRLEQYLRDLDHPSPAAQSVAD
jgi:hypothetical protein